MTAAVRVPMVRPLRGLRVRRVAAATGDGVKVDSRTDWLLQLRDAAVREGREHDELMACLSSLREVGASLPDLVRRNLHEVAALATEIGLTVAAEVVAEALERGMVDPTPTVRRCLEQATAGLTGAELEIHLHPEDLSHVMTELEGDPALRASIQQAHFVPDPSLGRAAVRIDSDAGRLLYDHREVLQRISDEVRKELGLPVPRRIPGEEA